MWQVPDKLPTWLDLRPAGPPATAPVDERDLVLLSVLGRLENAERLNFGARFLGFYRTVTADRGPLLVRALPAADRSDAEARYRLERWLWSHGVATPEPVFSPMPSADGASVLMGHRYVDHRWLRPEDADLRRLGSELAALHRVLVGHPEVGVWDRRTRARMSRLETLRGELAAGTRAGPDPDRLSRLASDRSLTFLPQGPRRPIHGDLNIANAIADAEDEVRLLDFEDVTHSVLSASFDLALVIERFVMVRADRDDERARLGRAFLAGYADNGGDALPGGGTLWQAVRTLNLRSLCVLALMEREGQPQPEPEWRKFLGLSEMAEARAAVWKDLN